MPRKRVIKVSLSIKSIDNAIKEIEAFEKKIYDNAEEVVKRAVDFGKETAKWNLAQYYFTDSTDELYNSIDGKTERVSETEVNGVIYAGAEHGVFVEAGTGPVGAGNHPILGGHRSSGWHYFHPRREEVYYTEGMEARPFMYDTAETLKEKIVDIAKDVFNE